MLIPERAEPGMFREGPDIKLSGCPATRNPDLVTGYPAEYRISGWILDIRLDTGYLAGYRTSGWIPDIRLDTGYLAGYHISGLIPDIRLDTGYPKNFLVEYRIPSAVHLTGYRIPRYARYLVYPLFII